MNKTMYEDVNLPLELMNRIDAEVMGHNADVTGADRRPLERLVGRQGKQQEAE